jgi:hypothetical protein
MRPVLTHTHHHRASLRALKKKIPASSVINSFFFFLGEVELGLAGAQRFISAHTNNAVIHEFWTSLLRNPQLVRDIARSDQFRMLGNPQMFALLQENWRTYRDPYVRAALFYLLSHTSHSGLPSSGEYKPQDFGPRHWRPIEQLSASNLHVTRFQEDDVVKYALSQPRGDYTLYALGRFAYNTLNERFHGGPEETPIDHLNFHRQIVETHNERPFVLLYKKHPQVLRLYDQFHLTMVDRFGALTADPDNCEDIIVTNF